MSYPLVSVIIPVYNVEEFLQECLESVIKQTYKNIEIITIDDGSTDNSLEILKQYASNDGNITIINQKNSGQSVARNKGIAETKGKYIYFLDSDDYILPETIENLISKMEKNNLDLIRFAAEPFSDNINYKVNKKQYDFRKYFSTEKLYKKSEFLNINLQAFSSSPVLYVVKRDMLIKNKIKFKPGIIHEDELFTLRVFLNANYTMYDSNFYYKRRYRIGSTMTLQNGARNKKSFDSNCIILEEVNKLLNFYTSDHEIRLIKKRIRGVIGSLIYTEIDSNYKKEKLKKLEMITKVDFVYYTSKKRMRRYLLPLVRMLNLR